MVRYHTKIADIDPMFKTEQSSHLLLLTLAETHETTDVYASQVLHAPPIPKGRGTLL